MRSSVLAQSPVERVQELESRGRRLTTPSGHGEMVWRVWGTGPVLILLHGSYGSWTHWFRTIGPMAEHFTVVAADLPGFGDSDPSDNPGSAIDMVKTVEAGLEIIVPGVPLHIAGFSLSALFCGALAVNMGQRVETITLVGSHGLGGKRGKYPPLKIWRNLESEAEILAAHRHNIGAMLIADPAKIDDLAVYLQRENTRKCRVRSKSLADRAALRPALRQVTARVFSIWGSLDATAYPYIGECEEKLRHYCAQADFRLIEGAGHWLPYEAPELFQQTYSDMIGA